MPRGFKLELEEILQKEQEDKNKPTTHQKKNKKCIPTANIINTDHPRSRKPPSRLNIENTPNTPKKQSIPPIQPPIPEKKSSRQPKPLIKEDLGYIDRDAIKGKSNPMRAAVSKLCEKGLARLKKNPLSDFFYFSHIQNSPSLSQIEKNIRNYKYKSIYDFIMDLRRIWNYYFLTYPNDSEIYQRTSEMSRFSEEIYKEIEILFEDKNEISEINKKIDNLARELRDIKGNQQLGTMPFPIVKKNIIGGNGERAMTLNEKSQLKMNIGLLLPEQRKNLVLLLADTIDITNKEYLEFDIETLSNKKLRELDKYVKSCLKKDKKGRNGNHHNPLLSRTKSEGRNEFNEMNDIEKLRSELKDNSIKKTSKSLNDIDDGNLISDKDIENENKKNSHIKITNKQEHNMPLNNTTHIATKKAQFSSSEDSESSSLESL